LSLVSVFIAIPVHPASNSCSICNTHIRPLSPAPYATYHALSNCQLVDIYFSDIRIQCKAQISIRLVIVYIEPMVTLRYEWG
jgi:hypothetical protein